MDFYTVEMFEIMGDCFEDIDLEAIDEEAYALAIPTEEEIEAMYEYFMAEYGEE